MKPTTKSLYLGILLSAWMGMVAIVQAQFVALSDGNSSVFIDPSGSQGTFSWRVLGQQNLVQQSFWYRVGDSGPQSLISALSQPIVVQNEARSASVSYANSALAIQASYAVTGGAIPPLFYTGPVNSDLAETITVKNISAAPLVVHLFDYADFAVDGRSGNEEATIYATNSGVYRALLARVYYLDNVDTRFSLPANHAEAFLAPNTLQRLESVNALTLADVTHAAPDSYYGAPDSYLDATWALEWDLNLAPGQSAEIGSDSAYQIFFIPEPAVSSLLLASLVVRGLNFRRRLRL